MKKNVTADQLAKGIKLTDKGGGTTCACFINYLQERRKEYLDPNSPTAPCAFVIVTDGYIEPPASLPHVDPRIAKRFLWIITHNGGYKDFVPPYGKKVKMHPLER